MKFLTKLNPWAKVAELNNRIAYLEGRLDEVSERAEEAEARAFDRAAHYYQFQLERARDAEKAAFNQLVKISELTPPSAIISVVRENGGQAIL